MHLVFASAEGASGGLVSLWDYSAFTLGRQIVLKRIVALKGLLVQNNLEIGIINVYGPNVQGERVEFFEQLNDVIVSLNSPVIVGGDFNTVITESKRLGSQYHSAASSIFENFISGWSLIEVLISGSVFTWFRGVTNVDASRLDRILISTEITCEFPHLMQFALPRSLSGHNPVLLKDRKIKKFYRPFKWFNHWVDDPCLSDKIIGVCMANKGKSMFQTFLLVKHASKEWEGAVCNNISDLVEALRSKIDSLEKICISNPTDNLAQAELVSSKARLWAVSRREEREWLQKSKLKWFKEGDKNTKFFHITAASRGRINHISKLKVDNSVFKNQLGIQQAFVQYFRRGFNAVSTLPIKKFDIPLKRLNVASRRIIESPFSE
ncbi:uncharacterized protein LOC120180758 [Hibiscus syriacus]|uniref:uncharacterized protein LOC120180758 n=1 Tax=Hibiscus syriacus TaxID=106335 RepID=UPI00192491CA|nr:uncharacterized protein LOC120180758 [Hibiscus syriacus]